MKKSDIFWQTYLNLEKELIEVSKYIFITDVKEVNKNGVRVEEKCNTQLETFSPHIADLLLRCCVEIEAISKELYFDLNGEKERGDSTIKFDVDCLKLINNKWDTDRKQVLVVASYFNLTKEEHKVLKPLKKQGRCWSKSYQAVKHDRYVSLCAGNVKSLINAMAALYLLNLYLRKDTWVVKYEDLGKLEYSMGSDIFSVKPPVADQLWEGNHTQQSDSPYVVTYQDEVYQRIDDIRQKEEKALKDYFISQPELNERAFVNQLYAAIKGNPHNMVAFYELGKYRLNKKIPNTLSFEERKDRLINSEEWKGRINQNNKHLAPENITADNIQSEIDTVGIRCGMEIMARYKNKWVPMAISGMCRVYIPE